MSSALRFAIGTAFVLGVLPAFIPAHAEDGIRPAHVEDSGRLAASAINDTAHDTVHDAAHDTGRDPNHDAGHDTGHACLDQRERHAEAGKVIPLSAAMRTARARMPGTVVRARLCRGSEGLVYVLTVLARDGKVARLTVDAVKGTLVGGL
jgi:uncharacterized membrane protein YkoI